MHKNLEEREKQIMKEQDEMEKLEFNDLEKAPPYWTLEALNFSTTFSFVFH